MFEFTWTYPVTLAACFSYILGAIGYGVAEQGQSRAILPSLAELICARLDRIAARIAFLLARDPLTQLPARPRRPPATPPAIPPTRTPRKPNPLRGSFGWLRRLLQDTTYDVTVQTGPLHHLLADPEILPRLIADPALGRALRPLCHMLGVKMPEPLRAPAKSPAAKIESPEAPAAPLTEPPHRAASDDPAESDAFLFQA